MLVIGLDLAARETGNTGCCVLESTGRADRITLVSICILRDTSEIIRFVENCSPDLIAIDAPLSLPLGRKNIEDRDGPHFRQCDIELRARGIRFFPVTLGPMRMLTSRGIGLKSVFVSKGYDVIEVYPGATYDILGLPRKDKNKIMDWIKNNVSVRFGRDVTQDELDGFVCAYTGVLHLARKTESIGNPEEGLMIIPKRGAVLRRDQTKNW